MRSSWSEDSHFTYLTCGPLGSGHGHADLTHISLYYEGKPFLVDSGRYSYMEEEPLRPALKSAQAHNVCVIDGESQGIPKGAWGYESYGECLKKYYREQGPVHYCEMAYHGTLTSGSGYLVIRRVLTADPGIWLIVNDIECSGSHVVEESYHLDPRVEALGEPGGEWNLRAGNSCLKLAGAAGFIKTDCVVSETYNHLSPASCLTKKSRFTDRHRDWTCLAGADMEMGSAPVFQWGSSATRARDGGGFQDLHLAFGGKLDLPDMEPGRPLRAANCISATAFPCMQRQRSFTAGMGIPHFTD